MMTSTHMMKKAPHKEKNVARSPPPPSIAKVFFHFPGVGAPAYSCPPPLRAPMPAFTLPPER